MIRMRKKVFRLEAPPRTTGVSTRRVEAAGRGRQRPADPPDDVALPATGTPICHSMNA